MYNAATKGYVDGGKLSEKDFYELVGSFTNPQSGTYTPLTKQFNSQNVIDIVFEFINVTYNSDDYKLEVKLYSNVSTQIGSLSLGRKVFSNFTGYTKFNFNYIGYDSSIKKYGLVSWTNDGGYIQNTIGQNTVISGLMFSDFGYVLTGTLNIYKKMGCVKNIIK